MQNLATRMMINVLGIPAILLLTHRGGIAFTLFFTVIAFVSQVELYLLMRRKGYRPLLIGASLAGIVWMFTVYFFPEKLFVLLIFLTAIVFISGLFREVQGATVDIAESILGFIYLPLMLSTLILLRFGHAEGESVLMMLFAAIWICDSLAYVFGKWLGHKKIAPNISPGKTVVGCIAGVVGALLTVYLFYVLKWSPDSMSFIEVLWFGLLCGTFGQAGDFVESVFKRDAGVKDSSTLLLGHGGMLDRFDSFFIGAPVIFLYVLYLTWIAS